MHSAAAPASNAPADQTADAVPPSIAALSGRTAELGLLLERWCAINSGSGHAAGLDRMRQALRDDFASAFPTAQFEELSTEAPGYNPPGSRALRIRMREHAPLQVILCGHFDTVYEADDGFQTCRWLDPLTLNAPGAADMKGGIVTMLAALQAFENTPHAGKLGWEVLLTPDEETGSRGTAQLFRSASLRNNFGFVFEPARLNGDIVRTRNGTGGITATCHGRAAHAAKIPNDGRNAILALSEFMLEASRIPSEMPGVLVNVGNVTGGSPATNVVPHFAEAQLDIRVTRAVDREPLLARLHAIASNISAREGFSLVLKGGFNRPPRECMPAEESAFADWQQAARELGMSPMNWVHGAGASDGNFLAEGGLPHLDGLGPIGDHLHSDREYCRVDTIAPRAQIAALFLHRAASGRISLPPVKRCDAC